RLVESGEAELTGERHQQHFVSLAAAAKGGLRGPQRSTWLDRLEAERDNAFAALEWRGDGASAAVERALRMVDALASFWESRGHGRRVRPRVEALLAEERARPA